VPVVVHKVVLESVTDASVGATPGPPRSRRRPSEAVVDEDPAATVVAVGRSASAT
jgi:hypothetical protein